MPARSWMLNGRGLTSLLVVVAGLAAGVPALAQPEPKREPVEVAPDPEPTEQTKGEQPEVRPDQPEPALKPMEPPPLAEAVTTLLDQAYLSEAERAALRIKHGLWEESDLTTPALRAKAALTRGNFMDSVFDDASVPVEDRAEARWRRGEPEAALELLKGAKTIRAARLSAEALYDLGRPADAATAAEAITKDLSKVTDVDELVEGVRARMLLARIIGASRSGAEFQQMNTLLTHARDDLDRLSWRAPLAEAVLLEDKNNYPDMGAALLQALSHNPRSAEAWYLAGRAAVNGMDFPRAETTALRLDELSSPEPSPYAAIVRALVQLRQQEGEAAEKALAPALARYPNHRELRAVHAAAAAGRFDFAEAQKRLDAFDQLAPGSPVAYLAVGKAMAGARQYEEAANYLREAVKRAPKWPEPVIELGLSEMQSGNNMAALDALRTATQLDGFNVRAENSFKLLKELSNYAQIESEHFIVRCKRGVDEVVAHEMLPQLEKIFQRVTGNEPGGIDHKPAGKTVVELYPNHRWFGVRITGIPQLHTIAAATGPVIAMEAPREGPGHLGAYDWARVVQHEYTHTVTLSRTKNRLPHWFTEAGAVYLEDSPRDTHTVELLARAYRTNSLFDFDTINIMFARPKKPTDRSQAYAQGAWMYEFIIERFGASKPLELMDLYAQGVREEAAFRQVLGIGRAEFLTQFKAYARDQLISWGMLPTENTPDINQLLKQEAAAPEEDSPAGAPREPSPELLEQWLAKHPSNPFVLAAVVKSRAQQQSGRIQAKDVEVVERYALARPLDVLPHKLLADFYLSGGGAELQRGPEHAIEHLEYLDAREQKSAAYAIELARQYSTAGDLEKAARKAERATQINPYDAHTREFAATTALRRQDYATAERHIKALVALEPDRPVHQQRLEAVGKLRAGAP
ncbi:MAG TPA: tetratricopeptide repeat protein [Phycisphaerales bacterium]|nr:tetratricopeptide repeat protein [Phycisphaerales bacterium]